MLFILENGPESSCTRTGRACASSAKVFPRRCLCSSFSFMPSTEENKPRQKSVHAWVVAPRRKANCFRLHPMNLNIVLGSMQCEKMGPASGHMRPYTHPFESISLLNTRTTFSPESPMFASLSNIGIRRPSRCALLQSRTKAAQLIIPSAQLRSDCYARCEWMSRCTVRFSSVKA